MTDESQAEELVQKAAEQLVQKTETHRLRLVRALTMIFVSMFAAVGISIAYTTIVIKQYEQTWCELVAPLDDQNKKTPPPSPSGKKFAAGMHHIRVKFSCK